MLRLSYTKAEAFAECARKGWALHTRQMPDRTGDNADRVFVGLVLDRVVGQAYDERWYRNPPTPDAILEAGRQSVEWTLTNVMPMAMTAQRRAGIDERLQGLVGIPEQMHKYGLVPRTDDDVRLQVSLDRAIPKINVTITGNLDILTANDTHGISLVDVKAGTYRKPAQLAWYLRLVEPLSLIPNRVGFWMPLRDEIEWRQQSRLPDISPTIQDARWKIATKDQRETPGSHCRMCPLRPGCDSGVRYLQQAEAANERLLTPHGVQRVSW
jgi:hypothetical protein